jgi:hypothetical protein
MIILEYKVHADFNHPRGIKDPDWIEDGGYWLNIDDDTLIGVVREFSSFYIPVTVNVLTPLALEERQLIIHAGKPMLDDSNGTVIELDEAGVRAKIQEWVALKDEQYPPLS